MMKKVNHDFVKAIPNKLEDGVLYISVDYTTVMHKCFCGCGNEVNTPLTPTDWRLIFDGDSVSLYPSVGNWNLACKSHYWIDKGEVLWAEQWSEERVNFARDQDLRNKEFYYRVIESSVISPPDEDVRKSPTSCRNTGVAERFWSRFKNWIR